MRVISGNHEWLRRAWRRTTRLFGVGGRTLFLLALAAVLLVPASRGHREAQGQALPWRDFEEALAVADSTGRSVMVAVYAPWCGWCRKMKRDVYPSPGVRRCLADDFVLTRLNRDDTDTRYRYHGRRVTPRELASTFRADGVPATVLLSPRGDYLLHLSGYVEPTPLRTLLAYVATKAYRHMSYRDFRADPAGCAGADTQSD